MLRLIQILLLLAVAQGCALGFGNQSAGFDRRPISIHSISLFNQRITSRLGSRSWKGDWIFRRDRLELIDASLRTTKPDLLVAQEIMERSEGGSESDIKILTAGILWDYDWQKYEINKFSDTQESEFIAVALALPLKFSETKLDGQGDAIEFFRLGKDGYLMLVSVDYEDQPITVLNVHLPYKADGIDWIPFIQERALDRLERLHYCPKRVVLAGYLPGDSAGRSYANLLNTLQLRDTAEGFCKIESTCFTATPVNDIFVATVGDESPARVDKILVNRNSFIITSGRILDKASNQNYNLTEFGLSKLWPAQRFGWHTSLRFPRCRSDELL